MKKYSDPQYQDLIKRIKTKGRHKGDRTGTGTKSVFGHQMRFDLMQSFPLLTTKKLHVRSIIHELFWFLNGETNIKYLKDNGVKIWDEWANKDGELGPVYGKMWREWPSSNGGTIDQISNLMNDLKNKPFSRRHVISAYNPDLLPEEGKSHAENVANNKQALPPCHTLFQFNVQNAILPERIQYIMDNKQTNQHLNVEILEKDIGKITHSESSHYKLLTQYFIEVFYKVKKTKNKDKVYLFDLIEHLDFKNFVDTVINRESTYAYEWVEQIMSEHKFDKFGETCWEILEEFYYTTFHFDIIHILDNYNIPDKLLDCQLYQRSADVFLGVPFNIASYSLLVYMIAHQTNMIPNEFIWTGGDCHIYNDHKIQTSLQLTREPYEAPQLIINRKPQDIFSYKYEDFEITNYKHHAHIKGQVSV